MIPRSIRGQVLFERWASRRSYTTPTKAQLEELAGTAPSHTSYILLNTRIPPSSFPSRISSKLQRTLQLHTTRWGGLVNFAWSPETPSEESSNTPEWDPRHDGEERYSAVAFSHYNGALEIPEVNLRNVEEVAGRLRDHASVQSGLASKDNDTIHLYVCTHGERDCRCGETGGEVYTALREEVQRRALSDVVKVGAVGHVGGHKYAANVLVFPYGEWLGHLTPSAVPHVLDSIMSYRTSSPFKSFSVTETSPLCPTYWRGRMGLDKVAQLGLLRPPAQDLPNPGLKPRAR
ncbi:hypothetical protein BDW22DRAFT_1336466 [Trametopsis cervina]|nr:hypothetical protein BDW22DRAFT_1336466 [Trametopsis cervina]